MDNLQGFIGIAFSFFILLPLLVYFVLVSAAPKKTKKEKLTVFILSIAAVMFMTWNAYIQGHSNVIQSFVVCLVFIIGLLINIFELHISKAMRAGILIFGVGVYLATGAYN